MQVGDLVKINKRCDAGGLWHKVGIVVGRKQGREPSRRTAPLVRVLLDGCERLFDYCALDVINASR